MNMQRWAMDGSVRELERRPERAAVTPVPDPGPEPGPEPLPEREWGLSAGQVVVAVLAIVAFSELVGLLG